MPLILDANAVPKGALRDTVQILRKDLEETLDTIRAPPGRVLDSAGLESAETLVRAALASIDRPGPREPRALALDANLAYAALVAAIDLVKSHTDVPRVPQRRVVAAAAAPAGV
jgi:hypothetical protein